MVACCPLVNRPPADLEGRDWLGEIADDMALLVIDKLLPGPFGRGDFRRLCRRARCLANSTVARAQVHDWVEAARMGTTFPKLEGLAINPRTFVDREADMEGARAFLEHSAPQLTRLTSLEILQCEIPLELVEQLCRSTPQLRLLSVGQVRPQDGLNTPRPVMEVVRCITQQLSQLVRLRLQVCVPCTSPLLMLHL